MKIGTATTFRGFGRKVARFSGAECSRVSHGSDHFISEHKHDWPTLTLSLAGAGHEEFDTGAVSFEGPTVIFHPAGTSHSDRINSCGLETFGVAFDPHWLRSERPASHLERSWVRVGGQIAALGRDLCLSWLEGRTSEHLIRERLARFLEYSVMQPALPRPRWFESVEMMLQERPPPSTAQIAKTLGLHPAWLARAYRNVCGEGIRERLRRRRVEAAMSLLRTSRLSLAEVAFQSGFCDQAHMNRCFRSMLQTTPTEIARLSV